MKVLAELAELARVPPLGFRRMNIQKNLVRTLSFSFTFGKLPYLQHGMYGREVESDVSCKAGDSESVTLASRVTNTEHTHSYAHTHTRTNVNTHA